MAPVTSNKTPSLATFLKSHKQHDIATSTELLISLLKRRQIQGSRACALATTHILLRVVASERVRDTQTLIQRVREVGSRLAAAQSRELAVGNVVRRVLGVIREVAEDDQSATAKTQTPSSEATAGCLHAPSVVSPFDLFGSQTGSPRPLIVPDTVRTPKSTKKSHHAADKEKLDIKAEVIDGIKDLLDEIEIEDTQIAESALSHIFENDRILTHTSSPTVQKFLTAAAKKRKFTVFHAESYPNDHESTHSAIFNGGKKEASDEDDVDDRWKPLTSMGIKVVVIPDQAAFALMHKMDKVIVAPHAILTSGSAVAAAGAGTIVQAAKYHSIPVLALGGVYKVSPVTPEDPDDLIEYGSPEQVIPFEDGEFLENVDIVNPIYDWIDARFVDLYITNIGGHTPSAVFRVVEDHYSAEDFDLTLANA